jgi:succinoglycan biosynthesis protein ExoW
MTRGTHNGLKRLTMTSEGPELAQRSRIGVLIPYFQQDAGLLRRALGSVAAQEYCPVQVVVIDDGSPRAAAEEITPELCNALQGLTVIRQVNRGIAAARNAGLDALTRDVSAIALLDSDDYWQPSHLRHAAAALSLGADFFFSNSRTEGDATDFFDTRRQRDLLASSQPIQTAPDIVQWPHGISALFGGGCPFATSTVVFRRALLPDLRFSTKFRRAAEDHAAFWELLTRASVIMFCTEPTLVSGCAGVGAWRNSTFGSIANLVRLADELRWLRQLVHSRLLSPGDRRLIQTAITARRHAALTSALHLLRRRRNVFGELLHLFRSDPACAASWCVDLSKLFYRKIRSGSATAP